ncbi:DUF222 domain-containing protein [Demequina sp. SYSU T00039]|uniref:DUF222 domain-containing protein n=1 Tax=Demequina lignilytica TaxID=3051663 RepID=A0AAW7M745_9MICO|nr:MULTISPECIES: HNH endonuclease signature motif containing protein [unclassified Demequina]MDN4478059.1 DUF222 domain-containing protein [Demequina sp. SYSU T00039-1]MDN4488491.1 DUF222 domain-containing protein [Demequina sp. SYSU T00039]
MTSTAASAGPDPLDALRARVETAGALTDWDLVALISDSVARRRESDLILAAAVAEAGRRSGPGAGGLARRRGFSGVDQLVAGITGGTVAEAERLRILGSSLDGRADDSPSGASVLPYLAVTAREGRISPDAFVLIHGVLMQHPDARDADGLPVDAAVRETPLGSLPLERVERMVVDKAVTIPLRSVRSLVRRIEAGLTPPRVAEDRYDELHALRQASIREESNGMIRLSALLDPLTAAPLMAAVDGYMKHAYRAAVEHDAVDGRTPGQLRADALGWLGRHANGCERPHDAVKTTVVVRLSLTDLESGQGHGAIDGIDRPIPIGVLRRQAADAEIIPTVLGTRSEVLDQGAAKRFFTPGQRRAIAERDRGCAKCGLPPAYCDTHHVREWQHGGRTDVDDGIMLCVRHHHMIHRERWRIRRRGTGWQFIPPASVDPRQEPIPGHLERTTMDPEELRETG